MRSEAPALMPIFRSQHQAALLAWLLLHPGHEYTLTELAKRLDVPLTTLQREAQRLVVAGLLQDRTLGRSRLLRANMSNRAAAPLTQLLEVTFGPQTVIGEEFDLTSAEQVLIYGSWAERSAGSGEADPDPRLRAADRRHSAAAKGLHRRAGAQPDPGAAGKGRVKHLPG